MVRFVAVGLVGCGGDGAATTDSTDPTETPTPTPTPTPLPTSPSASVIQLETEDGVTLEADYWAVAPAGSPGVVLLHMIPPANDRTTWPAAFSEALSAAGYAVLAVDRRGAGGSEGVATEAYTGPNGKLDVAAAADRLAADGYGPLAILGASNGTTSMIDYAVWAEGAGHPAPVALGFLSGGSYTEAQTPMSAVPAVPATFTYPPGEAAWNDAQRALRCDADPDCVWTFREYAGGEHGTRMFDVVPSFGDDLLAFLREAVPTE